MHNFLHVASCTLKKEQQLCNIDDVGNSVFYFQLTSDGVHGFLAGIFSGNSLSDLKRTPRSVYERGI